MSLHRHLDALIGGFILSACKGTEKFAHTQEHSHFSYYSHGSHGLTRIAWYQ